MSPPVVMLTYVQEEGTNSTLSIPFDAGSSDKEYLTNMSAAVKLLQAETNRQLTALMVKQNIPLAEDIDKEYQEDFDDDSSDSD